MRDIYLAGGCFWGMQGYFDGIEGILETHVGYANGNTIDVTYKTIKETGHAECIHIIYDENIISLRNILKHYFRIIDPTILNRQGNDIGRQYRTGIYYTRAEDEDIALDMIELEQSKYDKPIVVEVCELVTFTLAEEYHQDYLKKNPNGYCHIDISLKNKPL